MKNTRFLIASGGTGGHFYPGFALGKYLHTKGAKVLFVVRKDDPATSTLAANGLDYEQIDLIGLPRSGNPLRHLRFIGKLIKAFWQTRRIIKKFKPQVTLGMGGYVSFPLIFCSHLMGVKTAVHDSNAIWGLSNKICACFANLRLMGLPTPTPLKGAILTSTPIRAQFAQAISRQEVLNKLGLKADITTVLIMGGSQGAKGLNEALPQVIKALPHWQFIHLTGTRWYKAQQAAYAAIPHVKTLAYSDEVYQLIKAVDLIICRSGASTLAEVIACQLPAVLVPYPHAAANHQYFNAQVLAQAKCACIVQEGKAFAQQLQTTLQNLSARQLIGMKESYKQLHLPSPLVATQTIAQLLENL